jgi:hypothetical protein
MIHLVNQIIRALKSPPPLSSWPHVCRTSWPSRAAAQASLHTAPVQHPNSRRQASIIGASCVHLRGWPRHRDDRECPTLPVTVQVELS